MLQYGSDYYLKSVLGERKEGTVVEPALSPAVIQEYVRLSYTWY